MKRKSLCMIGLNLLILVFGIIGLLFSLFGEDGFMNTDTFLYYTIQSNLLAMATAAVVVVCALRYRGRAELPKAVQFLRLLSTIAITLTFLVFSLMLTPEMIRSGNTAYLTTPGNVFVHNLVPIGAILDWCLFASVKPLPRRSALCGLLPALSYVLFVFICVFCGIRFSGNTVPYFFLDYETYGWLRIGGGIGVDNLSNSDKAQLSDEFDMRFEGKLDDFIGFICDITFAVNGDYKESWEFIKKDCNSLKRYSNVHLIFNKDKNEE